MTTFAAAAFYGVMLLGVPPVPAQAETVEFDGETYTAAYRSNQPTVRLIEYVRDGETVETWTKLFAARNYPQQTDPRTAVAFFKQALNERNPQARSQVLVKQDGSEAMIDFLIWTPGEKQMEFNVHRYLKLPGRPGLVSFQFAYRIPDPSKVTADEIRALKTKWVDAMSQLPPPNVFEN